MKFEYIFTTCKANCEYLVGSNRDAYDNFVPFFTIEIKGIPADWDEDKIEKALSRDIEPVDIGYISGYMVLGQAITEYGFDMWDCCDSVDSVIEHAVSALTKNGGPLSDEDNLFFISELAVSNDMEEDELVKFLINLPDVLLSITHVYPSIVGVYPPPLPHEKSKAEQIQDGLTFIAAREAVQRLSDTLLGKEPEPSDEPELHLSLEQINKLMGRRNSGESYDEEYIDENIWDLFEKAGFSEWKNTKYLYKTIV